MILTEGSITAKEYINTSSGCIKAGEFIETEGIIKAKHYIKTGGYIKAKTIMAESICSLAFLLSCESFSTTQLPFSRHYYAHMEPCLPYKHIILDESKCWTNLRKDLMPFAKQICDWSGWHWIIQAQIRMFFGLSLSEKGISAI